LSYKAFDFTVAAAAEFENTADKGSRTALAWLLDGGMQLPTQIIDRLSLSIVWSSGEGPSTAAFYPVVRDALGFALKPSLSGMMIIRLNYGARLLPALSADLGFRYFIRTDSESFTYQYLNNDSYLLGAELNAGILWALFSDLAFTLEGGVLIPSTGDAWERNAPAISRIIAGIKLSL